MTTGNIAENFVKFGIVPCSREHLNNDDSLQDRREDYYGRPME